jgi:hypothetical protein
MFPTRLFASLIPTASSLRHPSRLFSSHRFVRFSSRSSLENSSARVVEPDHPASPIKPLTVSSISLDWFVCSLPVFLLLLFFQEVENSALLVRLFHQNKLLEQQVNKVIQAQNMGNVEDKIFQNRENKGI